MAHFLFCTCITLKLLLPNFSSEVSLTASESDRTQVCTQGNAIPSQTFLLNRMVYLKTSGMSANGTNDEIYPIFAKCYGCFRCFIFVALLNPYNNPTKQVLILSSFCKWRNWSIERVTGTKSHSWQEESSYSNMVVIKCVRVCVWGCNWQLLGRGQRSCSHNKELSSPNANCTMVKKPWSKSILNYLLAKLLTFVSKTPKNGMLSSSTLNITSCKSIWKCGLKMYESDKILWGFQMSWDFNGRIFLLPTFSDRRVNKRWSFPSLTNNGTRTEYLPDDKWEYLVPTSYFF